ncbi:L-type lectin-domain containing receptor kinase IX.1-like [Pyrus communis]|uniref:L-type lectin-domain containing receptor kinase IX.1-like n=1 Tax=Pyrus communis TaxID=23211 RepID=UPI0035C1F722
MSHSKIVSVEFDTHSNSYWDPAGPHVGININRISSVVHASWNFSGDYNKKKVNVWITYNATTKNLSVFWTNKENPVFVGNSSLSYNVDLRKCLPDLVTIGFSAATGQYPERHTIYSWDFNSSLHPAHEKNRKHKRKGKKKWLIVVFVASFLIVAIGVALSCFVKRILGLFENGNHSSNGLQSISAKLEGLAVPKRFSYEELVVATNDFAKERRLGQGGSGQVYKGILQDLGCLVAVKRILTESEHYEKIFINEVKIISHLFHRNLVEFIGWCHKNGECLLVYAYMSNGSLDTHLFGSRVTLQWESRYKIALGLASALHYLHEEAEQCVLHRDIKSANVLLDDNFSTKLGDFGIAKLVDPRFRSQTTGVVGTFGYMAPEYASGGRASKESDIYSLGVVALEIACGRRTYQDEEYHVPLFRWVWQLYLAGNLLHVADERLNLNFDRNEMECLLFVGLWCTHPMKTERPKAGQVIKVLQLEAPLPELPPDMHDHHPLPQPQHEADSASHISLTSSLDGR